MKNTPRRILVATHKFPLQTRVRYQDGYLSGDFRVTGHLPDGGSGLQYRIKSDRDGHERIVVEASLQRPL